MIGRQATSCREGIAVAKQSAPPWSAFFCCPPPTLHPEKQHGLAFLTSSALCRTAFPVDKLGSFQVKVTLGSTVTRGLGAGGKPEVGQAAAVESLPEIEKALAGADMVFVTAGEALFLCLTYPDSRCALQEAEAVSKESNGFC